VSCVASEKRLRHTASDLLVGLPALPIRRRGRQAHAGLLGNLEA